MASLYIASPPERAIAHDRVAVVAWWDKHWPEVLLAVISTAIYFGNLTINGWGNPYYAAAAQAGAGDWNALLFGSADAGNGITVDKPPLHVWVLALSIKTFGLSSMSVLAPQAVMGIATAWLVQKSVMAWGTRSAGFLAGLFFVLTPVTSMIFRFNNPDSLLLFLWALAAFLIIRSVRTQDTLTLHLGAAVLGLAFLCKQFQGWILAPAVMLAFLVFGFGTVAQRIRRLITTAVVMITPAAVWLLAVELTPAARRPWIGGSATNSVVELTFGYNGLGRLTGQQDLGAINPKDFEGVVGYDASPVRLLTINYAPEVAWFLPTAVIGAVILLKRLLHNELDRAQSMAAALTVAWFITTFSVLSFMTGDIHPYYTSMLAIPLSILSAYTFSTFWEKCGNVKYLRVAAFLLLACTLLTSGILTWFQNWHEWPGLVIKVAALTAAGLLFLPKIYLRPRIVQATYAVGGAAMLLVPFLFVLESISAPQQGSFPISGPVPSVESWHKRDTEQLLLDEREKYALSRGEPVVPEIAELIENAPVSARWAAVTTGSENAALYQLNTGRPVLSIGGFSALDGYPSLETFQGFLANGQVSYYIHQPGILKWSTSPNTSAVVAWIENNFDYIDIDGVRLYDFSKKRV